MGRGPLPARRVGATLWRFSTDLQVRRSAANLLGADYETATREVFGTTDQRADTIVRSYRSYAVRAEFRF